ncbi:MAG: DEAD/DEAH box helicase [Cetobacterium sp.]
MKTKILESLKTSVFDSSIESKLDFQYKLLSNKEKKIVIDIRKELEECDEFIISVAFITEGGLALLLEQLKILEEKGVKGKILTGDYLNFTQPKALERLLGYKNIEVKLLFGEKFHAKGYFFKKNEVWTLIVGSSNLTQTALTVNFEWNLKINSLEKGKILNDILDEFNSVYKNLPVLTIDAISDYKEIYNLAKTIAEKQLKLIKKEHKIKPNKMQEVALQNLEMLRGENSRGLLISATGTGKTILSAFDIKAANAQKVLFIAHRKTILEKARSSYNEILGNNEVVFAMVQTLSKKNHLEKYKKDSFDYIVIDEVHHSGAKSYQDIINYFTPKFLLGMTATPERGDDFDIYELFDHKIAYEIRLHDALKEGMLCPFHYFGISDIVMDGKEIDEKTTLKNLVVDERVNHIIEKSRYYGYSGETLHGLIFVSRVEEAKELAQKLVEKGIKALALTGESTDVQRESSIEALESGEIEYLITVDIFNEGVDIPCVNQVIFLRPTESSIVYIQQLGRGLRKNKNKEYVVILDFIGNYEKSFLIPSAIAQDNSYNKDSMKMFLLNGTNIIPGESTVTFEKIVRERIFENINKTNFSTKKAIEHDFDLLQKQLGRIPLLNDFYRREMMDPNVILKFRKDFDEVLKVIKPNLILESLNGVEKDFLTFLSSVFTPAKRIHEMIILKSALNREEITLEKISKILEDKYNLQNQNNNIENALKHLSKDIFTSLSTIKSYNPILLKKEDKYEVKESILNSYKNNTYFKTLIDDVISYNLEYAYENYKDVYKEGVVKYKNYTKQEAFWYMNLDFNNGYQVSGYTIFEQEKKVMIFITLDDSDFNQNYENIFYDKQKFNWFSKSNRCLNRNGKITGEGKIAQNEYVIEVFLKKKMGETFFYLGEVSEVLNAKEILGKKNEPLVEYELMLKEEINADLFLYFNFIN